ncbi:MAG TPA: hypothetical protein PK504_08715 [Ferruginibacter sp.]|nr:hypothetical protein [Ferruginibacter sp.]HRE64775.1 hypothetical protein [Ferruginibacter sp.]
MAKGEAVNPLKRLRNHYRLVIMNEDTYEEVVKFKLNRVSAYIAFSTIFILMIALTTSLIIFTPLKYYLPGVGYGDARQMKEYRSLKIRTDSMEQALKYHQQYFDNINKVLTGKLPTLDTTTLNLPKVEESDD